MHKLAELCVRRPVFATMLVLSLTVVGAFSFFGLGVDLFPEHRLPDGHRLGRQSRRGARAGRDRDHEEGRRRASTPSAASTSCVRRRSKAFAGLRHLPPRKGRRRRGAGSPRQGQPDHSDDLPETALGARHHEVRSRRRARLAARRLQLAPAPRGHRSPTSRSSSGSRASTASARSRSSAARSARSRFGSIPTRCAPTTSRSPRWPRRCASRTWSCLAAG